MTNVYQTLVHLSLSSFLLQGEFLLKNADLHARSLYPIYSLFYFIVFSLLV